MEALCKIFRKLVTNATLNSKALAANNAGVIAKAGSSTDGIDRSVFRELLHSTFDIVTEETLMERIFCAWEKGYEGLPIRLEGWILGLSTFLKGTQAEKTAFCFRVYDLNSDGYITKDEMFALLRNCLIKQPQDEDPDEGVKDLVEIALRKLDMDKDGKVRFSIAGSDVGLISYFVVGLLPRLPGSDCRGTFAFGSLRSVSAIGPCNRVVPVDLASVISYLP